MALGAVPGAVRDRWGPGSGKAIVSLRKIEVLRGPGDPPGRPGRGAETPRDQLWATASTPKVLGRGFRSTLNDKMWPEDRFSSTFGSGKVIRVVVFDTEVTILCFELHCVSKNVFTSEAITSIFSGSAAVAAWPVSPPTPAPRGPAWGSWTTPVFER